MDMCVHRAGGRRAGGDTQSRKFGPASWPGAHVLARLKCSNGLCNPATVARPTWPDKYTLIGGSRNSSPERKEADFGKNRFVLLVSKPLSPRDNFEVIISK